MTAQVFEQVVASFSRRSPDPQDGRQILRTVASFSRRSPASQDGRQLLKHGRQFLNMVASCSK
jgi:hypothetical protein